MTIDEDLIEAMSEAVRALDLASQWAERDGEIQAAHYTRARADRLREALANRGHVITDEPPQAGEDDCPC